MPDCPKGFRWDKKLKRCVPKGGTGGGAPQVDEEADGGGIYIGVPDDYRVRKVTQRRVGGWGYQPGEHVPTIAEIKPRYKEGGESRQLSGKSPDFIFGLQVRMVALGLLEEEGWIPGAPDPKTKAAFKELLGTANSLGMDYERTLNYLEANAEAAGGVPGVGGEEREPLQVVLTNPANIAEEGRAAGQTLIGRDPSSEELMQMAGDIHNQQRMMQTDAYNRGLDPGEFVEEPSTDAAAAAWLRQHRGGEIVATSGAEKAAAFEDLLVNSQWRLSKG